MTVRVPRRSLLAAVATLAVAAGCAVAPSSLGPPSSGVERAAFDPGVRAQDDLYRAANGRWLAETPIPPDRAAYGSFSVMHDRAEAGVRAIAEAMAADRSAPAGRVEQQIGSYYRSYLDEAAIDRAGLAPLAPWLAELDAAQDGRALAALMGRWQGIALLPMAVAVYPDPKEPTVYRAVLRQSGLGLPDREYVLGSDARFAAARAAYATYVEALLRAAGDAQAAAHAAEVLALERRLAEAQWNQVDSRDALKTYNPMTPAALAAAAPGFDWPALLGAAALPAVDRLLVHQPGYATAFARVFAETPPATWRLYLRTRLLDAGADVLPQAFRTARFEYRVKALRGQPQDLPRWKKATSSLGHALGQAVGRLYVQRHFPPAHKARMQAMVAHLMASFDESIDGLAWMTPATKAQARAKLARYTTKIGYPERWRDYAGLVVRDGDAFGNLARALRFEHERQARRTGGPVDKGEWLMNPQTVNAYYDETANEIVFPAAILQPPFFDMAADDAANYGAIGAIIGHEISHGFDDQGSRYDGAGRLHDWWSAADRQAFDALADRLVAQYDAYEPLPGRHVNGRLTLGENIADVAGLQVAHKAWRRSLGGRPAPVIDGLTGDQRFFLGFAQSWRVKARDAALLQQLTADPHSPGEFRANGAAVNHDAFHESFGTRPGDRMYKPQGERIRIW